MKKLQKNDKRRQSKRDQLMFRKHIVKAIKNISFSQTTLYILIGLHFDVIKIGQKLGLDLASNQYKNNKSAKMFRKRPRPDIIRKIIEFKNPRCD